MRTILKAITEVIEDLITCCTLTPAEKIGAEKERAFAARMRAKGAW